MSQTQWTANHLTLPPTLGVKVLRRGEMWCRGRCWWWSMQQVCLVCNTDWQHWVWRFKPISSPPAVSGGTSSNTQPCLPPASYNWWWRQRNDPLTRWQKKTKTMLRKHSPSSRIDTPLTYHRGQITGVLSKMRGGRSVMLCSDSEAECGQSVTRARPEEKSSKAQQPSQDT